MTRRGRKAGESAAESLPRPWLRAARGGAPGRGAGRGRTPRIGPLREKGGVGRGLGSWGAPARVRRGDPGPGDPRRAEPCRPGHRPSVAGRFSFPVFPILEASLLARGRVVIILRAWAPASGWRFFSPAGTQGTEGHPFLEPRSPGAAAGPSLLRVLHAAAPGPSRLSSGIGWLGCAALRPAGPSFHPCRPGGLVGNGVGDTGWEDWERPPERGRLRPAVSNWPGVAPMY